MRLLKSGKFNEKKILLIDKEPKTKNDRTWCFWETTPGFFEEIVYRKWSRISFLSEHFSSTMDINPYQYKMIRGIDFYNYCFNEIKSHQNVEIIYADIGSVSVNQKGGSIVLNYRTYDLEPAIIFNSIPHEPKPGNLRLLQHFKGWIIESGKNIFDPVQATLMDFRIDQKRGTSFVYVLPFSKTSALIEYTLFTREVLQPGQYDEELKNYLKSFLSLDEYKVVEEEFGIIPMTNEKLSFEEHSQFNIGAAGGQTKASSGYTFQFIQKQSQQIVDRLVDGKALNTIGCTSKRFRFYDNTLLHILYYNQAPGKKIFIRLFQKNKPQDVLRFLDNETSLKEELKIISSLPVWPFLKAALRQL